MIPVPVELDHVFVCTAPGAPFAGELVRLGLREGPANRHPGQGTANRRFFFANAMIELLWVSDAAEAQSPTTRRTLLWERWSSREFASPFGICLRPVDSQDNWPPFPGWEYRPDYLADPMSIHIGDGGIAEPMWLYLSFMRRVHHEHHFVEHGIGAREITALTLTTPVPLQSPASRMVVDSGILATRPGAESMLEIEFDRSRQQESVDLRPHLPMVLRF
jgi:hypothetical protein